MWYNVVIIINAVIVCEQLLVSACCRLLTFVSPWYDLRGWLGTKNLLSIYRICVFRCFATCFAVLALQTENMELNKKVTNAEDECHRLNLFISKQQQESQLLRNQISQKVCSKVFFLDYLYVTRSNKRVIKCQFSHSDLLTLTKKFNQRVLKRHKF